MENTHEAGIGFVTEGQFSLAGISMTEAARKTDRSIGAFQKLADRIGIPYDKFVLREGSAPFRLYDPQRITRFRQLLEAYPPSNGSRWQPTPDQLREFDLP